MSSITLTKTAQIGNKEDTLGMRPTIGGRVGLALCFFAVVVVAPVLAGWLMWLCLAVALLAASWIDTKTRLIPNRLTYPMVLFGISGNGLVSLVASDEMAGMAGIEQSLTGSAVCFGLMLLLFLSNATGGGDVKLATAIGAFLGPQNGLMTIAWCHVLAGTFVLLWMLSRVNVSQSLRSVSYYVNACLHAGKLLPISCDLSSIGHKRIPMAAFFTLGVLVTLLGYRLW